MMTIKDLLNKVWHDDRERCGDYVLVFRDFDAEKELCMTDIRELEGNFMVLVNGSEIPLHRVKKVLKKGEVVWERM